MIEIVAAVVVFQLTMLAAIATGIVIQPVVPPSATNAIVPVTSGPIIVTHATSIDIVAVMDVIVPANPGPSIVTHGTMIGMVAGSNVGQTTMFAVVTTATEMQTTVSIIVLLIVVVLLMTAVTTVIDLAQIQYSKLNYLVVKLAVYPAYLFAVCSKVQMLLPECIVCIQLDDRHPTL